MAYYNGNVAKGQWDVVICDKCAEAGAIQFETDNCGVRWQVKPWRWADWPCGAACDKCKKMIP